MTSPLDPDRWKQVTQLFERALDVPRESRAGFLNSTCAEDRDLRAEVESLLAFDQDDEHALSDLVQRALEDAVADAAVEEGKPELS